ncbi:uncharacterized protein EV422DRAFT_207368 [Fimicolochytrium jonesii]|uniref:uncharacterized protein n=1 Tax=Fimicolochytrium jonesii TaxID=1396493 RepID=UPI0022FE3ECA|nr:uncharacterized protein EV422DRAFT_207368 [Fimicolochytrium jonesii]KAI8817831.1 hypothetical protein EV422DRAFT_207368 [Fimicolochytrium jonesii]
MHSEAPICRLPEEVLTLNVSYIGLESYPIVRQVNRRFRLCSNDKHTIVRLLDDHYGQQYALSDVIKHNLTTFSVKSTPFLLRQRLDVVRLLLDRLRTADEVVRMPSLRYYINNPSLETSDEVFFYSTLALSIVGQTLLNDYELMREHGSMELGTPAETLLQQWYHYGNPNLGQEYFKKYGSRCKLNAKLFEYTSAGSLFVRGSKLWTSGIVTVGNSAMMDGVEYKVPGSLPT